MKTYSLYLLPEKLENQNLNNNSVKPQVLYLVDYYHILNHLYYLIHYSNSWRKLYGYVNGELLWIVAGVIILGNITNFYYDDIELVIRQYSDPKHILLVSFLGFMSSFVLGSSAKYASIVSLLTIVFGVEYFVLFFTLEYSGYLISPAHKCLPIGQKYFHTGFLTYLKALIIWIGLMIMYGVYTIL